MKLIDFILLLSFNAILYIILAARVDNALEDHQPIKYKVYYEYDVFNGDTIPCDTVFVKL